MKIFPAVLYVLATAASAAEAATIGYWDFEDVPGSELPSTLNQGNTDNWDRNILNSYTATAASGKGVYRLRRPGGVAPDGSPLGSTSFVYVGFHNSGTASYRAAIDSFSFAGHGGSATGFRGEERVRFELLDDAFPSTSARMILQRIRDPADGTSQVFLSGEALSVGGTATDIAPVSIFSGDTSVVPLSLSLDVDFDTDSYSVSYAFADAPMTIIGSGSIDMDRGLRYGRLTTFRKLDSTPTERIDIDSIQIIAVPECKTSCASVLALCIVLAFHRHAERQKSTR
ncbi:MAG: hypothetical protein KDB27_27045 [Planctomycetales bacterium]|nr:hypothetical protein [Planctomycetales bacterium]